MKKKISGFFICILLVVFAVIALIPFQYMLATAMTKQSYSMPYPPILFPGSLYFDNFINAWNSNSFGRYFLNSLGVASISTVIVMFVSSAGAYAFARMRLPKELEEAVTIDGGGRWCIYFNIALPLSKSALGTFAVLAFSNVWDEFPIALTMIKTSTKRTLPIALKLFQGQHLNDWGLIFAASLIAVLPILIIYIVMQKKLIRGGTMDGMLKG